MLEALATMPAPLVVALLILFGPSILDSAFQVLAMLAFSVLFLTMFVIPGLLIFVIPTLLIFATLAIGLFLFVVLTLAMFVLLLCSSVIAPPSPLLVSTNKRGKEFDYVITRGGNAWSCATCGLVPGECIC